MCRSVGAINNNHPLAASGAGVKKTTALNGGSALHASVHPRAVAASDKRSTA